MSSQQQIRQQITDQFIEALQAGGIPPWRTGWACHGGGLPANLISQCRHRHHHPPRRRAGVLFTE